jgi:signal transduction histidine kinase
VPGAEPLQSRARIEEWRSDALGALIPWNLGCAALSALVLTTLAPWSLAQRSGLVAGWLLVGVLALLAAAHRLPWRLRAFLFLAVNYGVVLLAASSTPHPGAAAFSHALALLSLAGLLLGARAALAAAVLTGAGLALVSSQALRGAGVVPFTPRDLRIEWATALGASFPAVVLVLLALRHQTRRLREALSTSAGALQELEVAHGHLAEAEKAQLAGRLAGALAHDLNNTLTVVVANSEWLAERPGDGETIEAAAQICEASRNAATLTQQVLLASRTGMAQPRPLELARATGAAAGALRRLLPPDIQVETRLAGPVWTHFDPGQLQQILLSLALNARAAMPGGGTLLFAVRPGGAPPRTPAEPPPAAILEVSDTGFGLDPEERRRAFDPPSGRDDRRGGGFGLTGVRALAEEGGGHVLLRSVPGTGTVVTLTLPGAVPPALAPGAEGDGTQARVLVVEDDIRVRALICTALAEAGHLVSEVADGTQAMRAIEELGAVDLLVTDVIMPGAPVSEVIETFRARHPGGRILVCSAFSEDEEIRRRVYAGEYKLLPKPFTRNDLLVEVRTILADRAREEQVAPAHSPRAGLRA